MILALAQPRERSGEDERERPGAPHWPRCPANTQLTWALCQRLLPLPRCRHLPEPSSEDRSLPPPPVLPPPGAAWPPSFPSRQTLVSSLACGVNMRVSSWGVHNVPTCFPMTLDGLTPLPGCRAKRQREGFQAPSGKRESDGVEPGTGRADPTVQ